MQHNARTMRQSRSLFGTALRAWAASVSLALGLATAGTQTVRADVQLQASASATGTGSVSMPLSVRREPFRFILVTVAARTFVLDGTAVTFADENVPLRDCFIVDQEPGLSVCRFWLVNPPGGDATVVVTRAPADEALAAAVVVYSGVDQENPIRVESSFGARNTDTSSQRTLAGSGPQSRILTLMSIGSGAPGDVSDLLPDLPLVELTNQVIAGVHVALADAAGAGSVTVRWRWSLTNAAVANAHYLWVGDVQASTVPPIADLDLDEVPDANDNCPLIPNPDQLNHDGDAEGDACDDDDDNDGFLDGVDACPFVPDAAGGCPTGPVGGGGGGGVPACPDADHDGICDSNDNCIAVGNASQVDTDADGVGDACDNCVNLTNVNQADSDHDGLGDACEPVVPADLDRDHDGILNSADNCPTVANADQKDTDHDGRGDACDDPPGTVDVDSDGDGIFDPQDNCPTIANTNQLDTDQDGAGDACDDTPGTVIVDVDADGIGDAVDNCPTVANADQADADNNGVGDACDVTPEPEPGQGTGAGQLCGNGACGAFGGANLALMVMGLWLVSAGRPRRRSD